MSRVTAPGIDDDGAEELAALQAAWIRAVHQGTSVDDVLARVASTPGAVSYLHVSEVPKTLPRGVTVLQLPAEKG